MQFYFNFIFCSILKVSIILFFIHALNICCICMCVCVCACVFFFSPFYLINLCLILILPKGAQCNSDVARSIVDRGGHIFWLHKDLRSASTDSLAVAQFNRALRNLDACVLHDQQRKGKNK